MTLTFITNSLTHHTAPLADALSGWLGTDFHFVETKPLRQERIQLGWQQEPDRPYLLRTYECPETAARCRRLALTATWCSWAVGRTAGFCPGCISTG